MSQLLIYGMGRSGKSALRLALQLGHIPIVVNQADVSSWVEPWFPKSCFSEQEAIEQEIFSHVDTIVISPGIDKRQLHLQKAMENGVIIISEIEFAYLNLGVLKAPIVAVTGTNGKTTTTKMIEMLLNSAGLSLFVGGNIGTPFCEYVLAAKKVDVIILELSSFQLESIDCFRADVALLLNITFSHGERYTSLTEYAQAKFNIVKNMSVKDKIIYYQEDELVASWAEKLPLQKEAFALNPPLPSLVNFDFSHYKLVGEHNLLNIRAAFLVGDHFKVRKQHKQYLIDNFTGVEFRLSRVDSALPFTIFNDAKSTNWEATLVALRAFDPTKVKLIIGGAPRGEGDSIIPHLEQFKAVNEILLFGATAPQLAGELEGKVPFRCFLNLEEIKEYLIEINFSDTLLFSPSFPSFDQFKNYIERGEFFETLFKE